MRSVRAGSVYWFQRLDRGKCVWQRDGCADHVVTAGTAGFAAAALARKNARAGHRIGADICGYFGMCAGDARGITPSGNACGQCGGFVPGGGRRLLHLTFLDVDNPKSHRWGGIHLSSAVRPLGDFFICWEGAQFTTHPDVPLFQSEFEQHPYWAIGIPAVVYCAVCYWLGAIRN